MTSPVIGTPWKKLNAPVSEEALEGVDKYWRVANYLSIGQIYLRSNPLMKEPFTREDVKHRLVGHWGTTPGLNFLIGHINRFIADHGQNTVFIMGPGHGGPAGTSQSYLDGTYTETYPNITKDEAGLQKFFRQFSYPGGIPSHFAPETPGSIHEGGELGYALSHAYGAIMDNPSLFVPCIVGDGEAETGPLATGWQSNKLVNPRTDGIVLPILHLNGYKIANPTILSRISDEELHEFFHGMGYEPYEFVAGFDDEDHMSIHRRFAELFESVWDEICDIKAAANTDNMHRPFYPMIIFRTPKLDLPEVHRRQEDRAPGALTRCRWLPPATPRPTSRSSRTGWSPTSRKSCSTPTAPSRTTSWPSCRRASCASAPTRTPTVA